MATRSGVLTKFTADTQGAKKNLDDLGKSTKELTKSVNSLGSALKSGDLLGFFKKTSIVAAIAGVKNLTEAMIKASSKQIQLAESTNMLNIAYKNQTGSADKLIDKLQTMYGLDPSGLTKQLGIYKQITNAMGMTNKQSALLSENFLKLQQDVGAFFNLDSAVAGDKLQKAILGRATAARQLGVDISTAALQQELYNRGINKQVNELNSASKTALRYLVMERQLSAAHGQAAARVNTLAGQLRVLKEQFAIAGRQIGAVFIPILQTLLPVLNGILMAFNQILGSVLSLFGLSGKELSKSGAGISLVNTGLDDMNDGLSGATKKAKELNDQLRPFDKLNVITTPKQDKGSGSGGAGGSSGIDPALWKQIKDYDLGDVANKAAQIKEQILKALKVFEPLVQPLKDLAGLVWDDITYVWEKVLKPMGEWAGKTLLPKVVEVLASALKAVYQVGKTMQPIFRWLMENVAIPFGRVIGKMIINALNLIKKAFDAIANNKILQFLVGGAGLIVGFKKLIDVAKNVYTWFGATKLGKIMGTYFDGILVDCIKETKSLTKGWKQFVSVSTSGATKLKSVTESLKLGFKGIADAGIGLLTFSSALQDINENGMNLGSTIALLVGAIMTIKGAIELTTAVVAIFNTTLASNPIVAVIGALIGAGGLIAALALTDEQTEISKTELDEYKEKLKEVAEETEKMYWKTEAQVGIAQNYQTELSNLVDANGKVTGSYDDVDKALAGLNSTLDLNIKRKGDHLYVNGNLIQSQKDLNDLIQNTINKLKEETIVEMAKKKIEPVYERRSALLTKEKNIKDELKKAAENYNLEEEDGYNQFLRDNTGKIEELNKLQGELKTNQNQLDTYYNAISDAEKGNFDNALTLLNTEAKSAEENILNTMKSLDLKFQEGWETEVETKVKVQIEVNKQKWEEFKKEIDKQNKLNIGPVSYYGRTAFADGGFVDNGQIFVAREAGPELVGKIGNKTAVANNDQIVNSIAKGLAMSGIGKDTNVNIIAQGDDAGFMNYITFKQQQRNRQYGL